MYVSVNQYRSCAVTRLPGTARQARMQGQWESKRVSRATPFRPELGVECAQSSKVGRGGGLMSSPAAKKQRKKSKTSRHKSYDV
jgi:hypothetical protein